MSDAKTVYTGGLIFDGQQLLQNHSAVCVNGICTSILPDRDIDNLAVKIELNGDMLSVGYADLQINGGGGLLFNDAPSVDTLTNIEAAHRNLGTTCMLPTLITDSPEVTNAAIQAVKQMISLKSSSIAGLHLEGPHLSVEKKGAHKAEYIRPMQQIDLNQLLQAAQDLPKLKITIGPESVSVEQVQALVAAGVIVALGHTNADYKTCMQYHQAGAQCVTHVYNAMSQLNSREPGLVGAALDAENLYVGLIADGVHVHPASIRAAWRAKACTGHLYLVTDAMALAGTERRSFELNGRTIRREQGRLTLADGTLAGADIDMTSAIRFLCTEVGVDLAEALHAAVTVPRRILGIDKTSIVGRSMSDVIRISAKLDSVCIAYKR